MNCQKVEASITDIAREQTLDVAARQAALAHLESCPDCETRLADERALTRDLRELAAAGKERAATQAPARLEDQLLLAFRDLHKAPAPELAKPWTTLAPKPTPKPTTIRPNLWWAAVAAMILVALLMAALRMQSASETGQTPVYAVHPQSPSLPAPVPQKPSPENDKPQIAPSPVAGNKQATGQRQKAGGRKPQPAPRVQTPGSGSQVAHGKAIKEEIVTDFMSLTQGYTLPMEGGQMVRVELPRLTLSSFGLPVNGRRLDELVKADVILGNDGIARAIRFVR